MKSFLSGCFVLLLAVAFLVGGACNGAQKDEESTAEQTQDKEKTEEQAPPEGGPEEAPSPDESVPEPSPEPVPPEETVPESSPEVPPEPAPEPSPDASAEKTPEPSPEGNTEGTTEKAPSFTLTSSAFQPGQQIPSKYGCGPERNPKKPSLPLQWKNPPQGTKSFVLLFDDLAPIANYWIHWLVVDIPGTTTGLKEGDSGNSMPAGAKELQNSFSFNGYGGPCPPDKQHTYRIRLFAMPTASTTLNISGKNGDQLGKELSQKALGVAQLQGVFPKP